MCNKIIIIIIHKIKVAILIIIHDKNTKDITITTYELDNYYLRVVILVSIEIYLCL